MNTEIAHQPLLALLLAGAMDEASFAGAYAALEEEVGPSGQHFAHSASQEEVCNHSTPIELQPGDLPARVGQGDWIVLVDVREPCEQRLGHAPQLGERVPHQAVPLCSIVNAIRGWMAADSDTTLVMFCRSGNRSAQAARALRRLGLARTVSLAGGMALWPGQQRPA